MKCATLLAAAALAITAAAPASAEGFRAVESRSGFVSLVDGKSLKRLGINLAVTPGGEIRGQAFGQRVTGAWRWDGRYFCRDLKFGTRDLGPNCQLVLVNGRTVRFVADKGTGEHADLRIE
ncbi:dihydrodipicolinate reductase [Rhodovulum tesquicola]|uniref:Dihydrodipicolinate reductase n=1 Tax=Rhodovulum steppense TaxID=540251 RepID=A0A4V2R5A0_9RHOB|nr:MULTISPECIES: dihydrodipicolinate reductase [Rhodovulum]MCO8143630.1 dihydrodipicolinate reductase [Rhodovulum tesquicola]TCM87624.1 hypothetical protein EV216_102179 [Rhodovulum steppense]